jgi:hypothetical protein
VCALRFLYGATLEQADLPDPVKNVWAFLRGNKLGNSVFATNDAIVETWCDAWRWLIAQPNRITSIGNREWAWVNQ